MAYSGNFFELLPAELLILIINQVLEHGSIKSLSSVSKAFRVICSPYVFKILKIRFSIAGLDRLHQISLSKVAPYVRTICYEASELIDPQIQCREYFRSCIYTASEYARDRREFCWNSSVTYRKVHAYFSQLSMDQQQILQGAQDLTAFQECLPRFFNLAKFQLRLVDGVKRPFRWFAGRVLIDWGDSFPDHFETMIRAIGYAKKKGTRIRCFEVSGFYSNLSITDSPLPQLAAEALSDVEDLRLIDSPSLLGFVASIALPSLQRFRLENCWLWIPELEQFISAHAGTLRVLHLEDTWLPTEKIHAWGISVNLGGTSTIIEGISKIKASNILRELSISGQDGFYHQYQGN